MNLKIIDLYKLLLSALVVAIHTKFGMVNPFFEFWCSTAVATFFAFSGYLIHLKIQENGGGYLLKYAKKTIKLYCIWIAIYTPLSLLYCYVDVSGFWPSFSEELLSIVFQGKNHMSWQLWYIHALFISVIFIWILYKARLNDIAISIVAVLLTIIAYLFEDFENIVNSGYELPKNFFMLNYLLSLQIKSRLIAAMGFIITGFMIHKYEATMKSHSFIFLLLFFASIILAYFHYPFAMHSTIFCLMVLLLNLQISNKMNTKWMRDISSLIFFTHMLCYSLIRFTIGIPESRVLFFSMTFGLSILLSSVLLCLMKYVSLLRNLLG